MRQNTVGLKSLNSYPPHGEGLNSHPIPALPHLRYGENLRKVKQEGVSQVGQAKIAIWTHTHNYIKFHENYQNDKWLKVLLIVRLDRNQ